MLCLGLRIIYNSTGQVDKQSRLMGCCVAQMFYTSKSDWENTNISQPFWVHHILYL